MTLKDYLESDNRPTGQLAAEVFKRYKQLYEECMEVLTAAIVSTFSEKVIPFYIKDPVVLELCLKQLTLRIRKVMRPTTVLQGDLQNFILGLQIFDLTSGESIVF